MTGKRVVAVLSIFLVLGLVVAQAQTKKWTRVGANTFARVRGAVPTPEVMKMLAEKYAGDLKIGFEQAGAADLYLPFLEALKAAQFKDQAIAVGERFPWMLFRVGGKVKAWQDVEWAGKKPLEVFTFDVVRDYTVYTFAIPKPCGNVALWKTAELKRPAPLASCDIVVSPAKVNVGELVTVDVSRCQNASTMEVEVFDPQGAKVGSHAFTPADPKWQTKFDKPGEYLFKGKAVNADGIASTNPCETKAYVNAPPVCKLTISCLPCKDMVGKPITLDASGSSDPDGKVVKVVFEVTDEAGKVVDSFTRTEVPFSWQKTFAKPGTFTATAVVFDDMGAASPAADACKIGFEVTQKRLFWLAEAGGLLARGTFTGYVFGRLGLVYAIVPDGVDLIVAAGPAFPTQGSPWKTIFMGHAVVSLHLGTVAYAGAGIGFSTKEMETDRKSGFDLVGQFGVNVFNNFTSAGSVFAEVRIPALTADRSVDNHYKLLLGFRYIF